MTDTPLDTPAKRRVRTAVNGFGRIGRSVIRAALTRPDPTYPFNTANTHN